MNQPYASNTLSLSQAVSQITSSKTTSYILRALLSGLLLPLGFAPFHLPGLAILSLAFLFLQLVQTTPKKACVIGFAFGLGVFGFGTSWVYASIHAYGHLNIILSGLITLAFVAFFSLYTAFFALAFSKANQKMPVYVTPFLFSSLWLLSEYCRSIFFTGFPWLLLGSGQIDSPLQHLLPIIGVLGVSWVAALSSSFLALAISPYNSKKTKLISLFLFVMLLILPLSLKNKSWTHALDAPISVAVIQADLSMRDQWDSAVYQKIESYYEKTVIEHMPKTQLIVMPESAIPLPSSYANHFLNTLHVKAKEHHSAVLLGIPHPSQTEPERYHNALVALGDARGVYAKQHLVPFGEYLPKAFSVITGWLGLPNANMMPGEAHQPAVRLNQHPFATLICYELAYPSLLRAQLPQAQFIVSLSDDGWFGHSLAVYQQLQLAQVLSKQTGRFQIVSNNNGLSSLINRNGKITDTLPAFSTGILGGTIYSATGVTPWVKTGDMPIVLINLCLLFIMLAFYLTVAAKQKSGYPNQPN